ncbi:hypothetical protein Hanom_Chr14g01309321 [Helianthus anomalus]
MSLSSLDLTTPKSAFSKCHTCLRYFMTAGSINVGLMQHIPCHHVLKLLKLVLI